MRVAQPGRSESREPDPQRDPDGARLAEDADRAENEGATRGDRREQDPQLTARDPTEVAAA